MLWIIEMGMVLNLGPQHPSTHGVLRLICIVNGEIIQWIITELGLLHRGTEKLIEVQNYNGSLPYFDRMDYVSTITQEVLFMNAIEKLINARGNSYVSLIRTLFIELNRILNHNLAITTHAIDLGLFTSMLWSFEEREKLICFTEAFSGKRLHAAVMLLGRLRYDITISWFEALFYWLLHYATIHKELYLILSLNLLWISRLFGIGIVNSDFIRYLGITGIMARAAGIVIDGRLSGFEAYEKIGFSIYLGRNSDCLDRYYIRYNEILEAMKIIYSLIRVVTVSGFNSYLSNSTNSGVQGSISPNSSFISMEYVIAEFLHFFPFMYSLFSCIKCSIESSKGLYSIFIHKFPFWTINIISNDFISISQINKFCRNINIADLIAVLGSIDFVLGSVDL